MADPLDALRLPALAVDPDPAFAAALRERLAGLLAADAPLPVLPATPGGPMTLSPYLNVADARAAIAFYTDAFGAVPRGEPYVMEDGRIGHAEVAVGGSVLMLADEFPEMGFVGPHSAGGISVSLHLTVPDVDAVVARAVAAGAQLEREPADAPYGRTGVVRDPAGHRWMVQAPATAASAPPAYEPRHGDVGYQSVLVEDVERTKAFFGQVLGWTYTPGNSPGGWQVEGVAPMTGLAGGADGPEVQLCFRVDDVASAVERVRAAGGTAAQPDSRPYGSLAECQDDQGMRFQLWQPPAQA
jgi:uncharacterized glyoxalase superfamily protein PhnB